MLTLRPLADGDAAEPRRIRAAPEVARRPDGLLTELVVD